MKKINLKERGIDNSSRTENFVRNTSVGILMQIFSLILSFASRTIFIKLLSNDYLSINGLFSNILSTLSIVELGFGTALIYYLYKPVARNDKEEIKVILKYYKKVYMFIGSAMIVLGLMIIPFMGYIIKDPPNVKENLNFIYILFLLSTSCGYFYYYKTALINAYQKNYIVSIYNQIFKWIQIILQIIILLTTKDYTLYLIVQLVCAILNYISLSLKANKMFPFIKEKTNKNISDKDKKEISNKVKSLIFYRLNPSILNGSDNIILSSIVGVSYVGIYSNYYLITSYISMFISQITSSLEIGVGNLNAIETKEKKEIVFYNSFYLCFFIYSIICILLMALTNDFINIWLGKEYLFSDFILFSIVLVLFVNGMQFACYTFRTTSGLFEKNRLVPLYEIIINIVVSIILAKLIGVSGVFLGTAIARLSTIFWTDPKILYDEIFDKENRKRYFYKYIKYTFITLLIGVIVYVASKYFPSNNYFEWIVKAIVLGTFTLLSIILFTHKDSEYIVLKDNIKNVFLKFKKIRRNKYEGDS